MKLIQVISTAVLLLGSLAVAQKIVIYEAGTIENSSTRAKAFALSTGGSARFCPLDFGSRGFTVACEVPNATYVRFYVNGKLVRQENVVPYTIAGNVGNIFSPWKTFPEEAEIACVPSEGLVVEATVRFVCLSPTKTPKPSPATNQARSLPDTPTPSDEELLDDFPEASPETKCVVMQATSYSGELPSGWVESEDSISFRPDNSSTAAIPPGASSVRYTFKAPVDGTYAVTLDMTTEGITDYNDVFLKFDHGDGFTLRKEDATVRGGTGYLKAYHNKNRRATEAFSIDHDPHSFSTASTLTAGSSYDLVLGGRSNKVTVHNLILFPCDPEWCYFTSKEWRRNLDQCI